MCGGQHNLKLTYYTDAPFSDFAILRYVLYYHSDRVAKNQHIIQQPHIDYEIMIMKRIFLAFLYNTRGKITIIFFTNKGVNEQDLDQNCH